MLGDALALRKVRSFSPAAHDGDDADHRHCCLGAGRRVAAGGRPIVLQAIRHVEGCSRVFPGVAIRSPRQLDSEDRFEHPLGIRRAWLNAVSRRVARLVVDGLSQ